MLDLTIVRHSPSSIRSVDPDQFDDFASNAVLAADRLSADDKPSRLRQVKVGGCALDVAEVNSHIKVDGRLDPNCLAVVVVLQAAGSAICEVPLDEDRVLILPKGSRLIASARPGLSYHATTLPSEMWHDICKTFVDSDVEPPGGNVVAFDLGPFAKALRTSSLAAAADLADVGDGWTAHTLSPDSLADTLGSIAQLCSPRRMARLDRSLRHRMRQAWQAQDFVHAHLNEDLSVLRLCKELDISRRQLEYAFRTAFEVSPREFIQLVRLNESRRRLINARKQGLTVTEIAMDVGVNHLGRFSVRYRELFGETARATLLGSA